MSSKETEEALKFVNKHTNPKTAINGRGFRKSKGQKVQEANVDQLEKKLLASKQRVVLHLKKARSIERSILQAELIEKQRKETAKLVSIPSNRTNVAKSIKDGHRRRGSSASQSWLAPSILHMIEASHGLEVGYCGEVQSTLNRYDDTELVEHLDKVPHSFLNQLSADFFVKVATLSSNNHVSAHEARNLFGAVMQHIQSMTRGESTEIDTNHFAWSLLVRFLRRKLMVAKLAMSLFELGSASGFPGGASMATLSTHPSHFKAHQQGADSAGAGVATVTFSRDDSGIDKDKRASPFPPDNQEDDASLGTGMVGNLELGVEASVSVLSTASPGALTRDTKEGGEEAAHQMGAPTSVFGGSSVGSPLSSPTKYQSLRDDFEQSQSRQLKISDRMVQNISRVYKSVQVDPERYPSATEFARRIVVRKLQDIMVGTVRRLLRRGFEHWADTCELSKLQHDVKTCLKSFSCYKLHYALEKSLDNKQYRILSIWKQRMEWYRDTEQTAAAGELQRHWRGSLARKRLVRVEKSLAVVYIQKVVRGVQGRAFMVRHRRHRKRERAARRVESAYMKYRWRKIRKNIQVLKRQKQAVADIQRCYRGLRGRSKVRAVRRRKAEQHAALKFQGLWRRFVATLAVERRRRFRRRTKASVTVQRRLRGLLTRRHTTVQLKLYRAARVIQCMARSRLARDERYRRIVTKASVTIQRVWRGGVGRVDAAEKRRLYLIWFKERQAAIRVMSPLLLGHSARNTWIPRIKERTEKISKATAVLQCAVRVFIAVRRVMYLRKLRDDEELRRKLAEEAAIEQARREVHAAFFMQRVARGFMGRRRAVKRRIELEHLEMLRGNRLPAYFRIKEDYFKSQNMLHRPYVIKIQCALRASVARHVTKGRRRKRAVRHIEKFWRSMLQIKEAKRELARRREIWRKKNFAATQIERVVRGFMGRYEFKKHEKAMIIRWFAEEVHSLGLIGRALQNFRVRKRTMELLERRMVLLQALVRRFLTRCKFIRGYKRLVRERDARRKKRRLRACITVQGFARIIRAKNKVLKRIEQITEENKIKAQLEEIDNKIDGIHSDHMTDLMGMRIQSHARGMLGKQQFSKKGEDVKMQKITEERERKANSATRIQAMVRGVQSREAFHQRAPQLRVDRKKRSFCVECEDNVATKKCRQCEDRYCDACFINIHKKGRRKKHNWEPLSSESTRYAIDTSVDGGGSAPGSASGQPGTGWSQKSKGKGGLTVNKKEWERFYDDTAKAYYWFNANTGEARWTDPTK